MTTTQGSSLTSKPVQVAITAGGETMKRDVDVNIEVKRNGNRQKMRADDIKTGDQILVENSWTKVKKVEFVDEDTEKYKGTTATKTFCFPGDAQVRTLDGRRISMSDLNTNTSVLTLDPSGKPVYSPIYMQTHANPTARLLCVSISAGGKKMELSHGHYLFVVSADGHRHHVTARDVKVGDLILGYDDITADFRPTPVSSVEHVERQGMYAPMTLEGSIVVNDVACSCYTDVCRLDPATAHALLWPLRRLWQLSPAGLALVCKPCDLEGRPALAGWFLDNVLSFLPTSTPL